MNADRQRQAEELFKALLDRDPADWSKALDAACGPDHELRADVESLLQHHDAASRFMAKPIHAGDAAGPSRPAGEPDEAGFLPPDARLGAYRILEVLGQGGMGVVYCAEQEHPRRVVALKVIRPGLVTPAILRRFEHEAQLLGRLQHPGIAQIFEAGTADAGRGLQPFFAMEVVNGLPVVHYADKHELDLRARLELLVKICDAVQHAHQKGIVHRDLKPANVLVDETGQPKILDFGVARATDGDVQATTLHTDIGQLIGTIPYMSPEQVLGDPAAVDTRSDVYALGVIAFELLTGRLPYDLRRKLIHEAVRVIRDEEPPSLSAIDKVYRGDVETIVTKALEKDKERRYQSASDLAADLVRYLHDEPIVARPASAIYQFRKFARRNRAFVGSAGIVAVVLVLTSVGMAYLAVQADSARKRATREAQTARTVSAFLQEMLSAVDPETARGDEVSVREVLERAAQQIDAALPGEPIVEAALRHTIGATYSSLGDYEAAEPLLRAALVARRDRLGADDVQTLETADRLAQVLLGRHEISEAEPLLRATLEARRRVLGPRHPDTLASMNNYTELLRVQGQSAEAEAHAADVLAAARDALGESHRVTVAAMINLGTAYRASGKLLEAENVLRETLDVHRRVLGPDHPQTFSSMNNLADLLRALQRLDEAETLIVEAYEGRKRVLGPTHPSTLTAMNNLGLVLRMQERFDEAEPLYRQLIDATRATLGPEHPHTLSTMNNLCGLMMQQGRFSEAEPILETVLEARQRVLGPEHPRTLAAMNNLASVRHRQGRTAEAAEAFRTVLDIQLRTTGESHPNTLTTMSNLATLYEDLGELDEAERLYRRVVPLIRQALGPSHPNTLLSINDLASLLLGREKYEEAAPLYRELIEGSRDAPDRWQRYVPVFEGGLGRCLTAMGRYDEAEKHLLNAYQTQSARAGDDDEDCRIYLERLAALYDAWDKPDKAREYRSRLEVARSGN